MFGFIQFTMLGLFTPDGSECRVAPRKMKEGDVGDFFHAVQASVANIFVTQENKERRDKLPFILNQVPTEGFTIMSLNEFVEFLRNKIGAKQPAKA